MFKAPLDTSELSTVYLFGLLLLSVKFRLSRCIKPNGNIAWHDRIWKSEYFKDLDQESLHKLGKTLMTTKWHSKFLALGRCT